MSLDFKTTGVFFFYSHGSLRSSEEGGSVSVKTQRPSMFVLMQAFHGVNWRLNCSRQVSQPVWLFVKSELLPTSTSVPLISCHVCSTGLVQVVGCSRKEHGKRKTKPKRRKCLRSRTGGVHRRGGEENPLLAPSKCLRLSLVAGFDLITYGVCKPCSRYCREKLQQFECRSNELQGERGSSVLLASLD